MRLNLLSKYKEVVIIIIYFILILLFWWKIFPCHLYYQEQFQLFLNTDDYFFEKIKYPGGLCDYVAEYFTQFYIYPFLGACIIGVLLIIIQQESLRLSLKVGTKKNCTYVLSFIPSLLIWIFLMDEYAMLAFVVSTIIILGCCNIFEIIKSRTCKFVFSILLFPVLYMICGGEYFIFVLWVIIRVSQDAEYSWKHKLLCSVIALIEGMAWPLLASLFLQYPLYSLFLGTTYYRYAFIFPKWIICVLIAILIMPSMNGISFLSNKKMILVLYSIVTLIIGMIFCKGVGDSMEEIMRYDYLSRTQQWQKIIEMAEKKAPTSPLSVASLNLALGETGQLGDRMFEFFQNGTEGLIPDFKRDFELPLFTNEIFYRLGMINTSQRLVFEAMEAIPDYKKSSRCIKRLVQTNLINGQYEVAKKYLMLLDKTLFYKKWADETLNYLYDEKKINSDSEYGWERKIRCKNDFLFSNREVAKMLGLLYLNCKTNKLALDYMLAYTLQNKDLDSFMRYFPLCKGYYSYHIPRYYQEALIFVWTHSHRDFNNLPWRIDPLILQKVYDFSQTYSSNYDAQSLLQNQYSDTYWYYFLYNK